MKGSTDRLQYGRSLVSILLVGGTTGASAAGGNIRVVGLFVGHREDGI